METKTIDFRQTVRQQIIALLTDAEMSAREISQAIGIMEKMIASEAVLLASPIYFWCFTAQIKALIDRLAIGMSFRLTVAAQGSTRELRMT